jgi:predicted O-methyltransferase YrrM
VAEFNGRKVVGFMSQGIFDRLDQLVTDHQVKTVVELGSFVGLSTCFLAERVERVITVDNFNVRAQDYKNYLRPIHEHAADDQYAEFLRNTLSYPNITGLRMDFLEAARLGFEADMVYIDGVQSYPAFKAIVEAWLPLARKVIAGDDTQSKIVRRVAEEIGAEPITERTWWKILY